MAPHDVDVSDSESTDALLSPQDGFFNQSSVPENVLVPDPAQRNTQADKEREARQARQQEENRASQANPSTFPQHHQRVLSVSSPRSSRTQFDPRFEEGSAEESTPLIPSAPPAYADVTSGEISNSEGRFDSRSGPAYNTMGTGAIFLPNDGFEDMGGSRLPLLQEERGRDGSKRSWLNNYRDKIWKTLVAGFLLCFAVVMVVTITRVLMPSHGDEGKRPKLDPGYSAGPAPSSCPQSRLVSESKFSFKDAKDFSFVQATRELHLGDPGAYVTISGVVHVRTPKKDLDNNVLLDLTIYGSSDHLMSEISINTAKRDGIEIMVPRRIPGQYAKRKEPCVYIEATIWVHSITELGSFNIETGPLQVILEDGVSISSQSTAISTVSGSVEFPSKDLLQSINSRDITVRTVSGSITGSYPLYDSLLLKSVSGAIDVTVSPKEASKDKARARLDISTASGSIGVGLPDFSFRQKIAGAPERVYETTIHSISGHITANNILHGPLTTLKSHSGNIRSIISPIGPLDTPSTIEVRTLSGTVEVTITPHLLYPKDRMPKLSGKYNTLSGTIWVQHPLQWQGMIQGKSLSGKIWVDWPGMKVDYGEGNPTTVFNRVRGTKGQGDGFVDVETASGTIKLIGHDN